MRAFIYALARPKTKHDLTSKTHIELYDYGLSGQQGNVHSPAISHDCHLMLVQGAERVVQRMQDVPRATNINLGHNPLRDAGLSTVIEHLCRDPHKNCVVELNLNNCGIGDWGLTLLSRYIEDNSSLRSLYLMGVGLFTLGSCLACH